MISGFSLRRLPRIAGRLAQARLGEAHSDLGVALSKSGQLDEAIASFGRALALKPDYAEAQSISLGCL